MKKAKLFMMLALLVMGVSNTWGATKDFYVNYEREFLVDNAGNPITGYTIDPNNPYSITKFEDLTGTFGDKIREVGDRMIRVTYNRTAPTAAQVAQYITAVSIGTDYTTRVVGIDNTIYICYIWSQAYDGVTPRNDGTYTINLKTDVLNSSQHKWSSGHFTYSDLYLKTDSRQVKNVIKLPANQCAIELNTYTDTEITIPKKDPDPTKGYDVVAIQAHGMGKYINPNTNYYGVPQNPNFEYVYLSSCDDYNYTGYAYNDHQNGSLVTVNFEKTSNVRSIGDYAFASCYALENIEIPQSVEYLGEAAFSVCTGLKDGLTFERASGTSFTTGIKVIRNYTFWTCQNMTNLELPDGILIIEGQQGGASMQYLTSLGSNNGVLRLPNTLRAIGPHFLCDASSLSEVTIPASVLYIDGACFHGCQSLREVYLLGPASALQAAYNGSDTFGKNETLCKEHVNNCVFITTQENIRSYATDADGVWQLIANNRDGNCSRQLYTVAVDEAGDIVRENNNPNGKPVLKTDDKGDYVPLTDSQGNVLAQITNNGTTTNACAKEGWNNALTYIPDQKVHFIAGKWVTVIFPKDYTQAQLKETFGNDVILAKMVGYKDPDYVGKDGRRVYQLDFQAQPAAAKNTPYMIKPAVKQNLTEYDVTMIAASDMTEDYRAELSKDHALSADKASDDTEIVMYGWFKKRTMRQWELYFQNPLVGNQYNTACVFKRIVDPAQAPEIKAFRCYWRIWLKGEAREDAGMSSAKSAFFRFADEDEQVTGIDQIDSNISIEIGNIYDLNGRKLDLKKEELPKGLFIIDGKKVMVK